MGKRKRNNLPPKVQRRAQHIRIVAAMLDVRGPSEDNRASKLCPIKIKLKQ